MKKVKNIASYILVLLVMFSFAACNGKNSSEGTKTTSAGFNEETTERTTTESATTDEPFTIGWSVYNSAFEFFKTMQEGVFAKAKELGIEVIPHDQKGEAYEMIIGTNNLIAQGIDALVISPVNPRAMFLVVELAKDAGIPVIVVDVGAGGADVEAIIFSDSFGGGVLAAEYALRLINEKSLTSNNVAIIKVEETSEYARRRGDAFKTVMEESGYQVVAEVTANSSTVEAYNEMKQILEVYGDDLAVVFAENDRMALGVAQAIDEAGKKGQIMVIGFDGDPAAIEAIKNGFMQGTIAQQPYEMGALGVELANTLLTGGTITYDDRIAKELYMEVFLIDETGELGDRLIR